MIFTGFLSVYAGEKPGPETPRTAFNLCATLKHIDISISSDYHSNFDMFDRFYAPDACGEMGRSIVQACDVYAWKAIE